MDNQNRRAHDKRAPGTVEWDESSKPATSVPAPVSPTNLHDAIMRLPCNPPGGRGAIQYNGYVAGHRDARHGAAELAASFKIAPTAADSPSTASDELHIGVSNNDQGVHINIMQRHADGTTTMIYSAKAPTGDSYGRASLDTQSAKQGAQPELSKPTDISTRLRAILANCGPTALLEPLRTDILAAAEEIERYYGGMLAWKQTAEKKDRDWAAERTARIDDRCAARAASQAAPEQAAQVQADARDAILEEAAVVAESQNRVGREWVSDSLWDNIIKRVPAAIRAMKSKRAASTDGDQKGGA